MKKAYLIHGWDGSPDEPLHQWIAYKLREKEYEVVAPEMPEAGTPKIELWLEKINEVTQGFSEEDILIGHSVGCNAILRFLSRLDGKQKFDKVILIAPWVKLDKQTIEEEGAEVVEIAKPWEQSPLNYKAAKAHCENFICIFSNNDLYVPISNAEIFRKNLDAKTLMLKGRGHFNKPSGIKDLPELEEFI